MLTSGDMSDINQLRLNVGVSNDVIKSREDFMQIWSDLANMERLPMGVMAVEHK